ncbi:uncharacterized protein ASPGLDRAFT_459369 [Aspergillus glaucus CBS 516.65]|uniref:Uncharacterized protein n=1 Tax=Aspergillus glaucus CBS 516.65 TaxID=1160497 RepID=A0A1L9VGR1_ASPGL|nr:hypothetical protein ASPGLDRAFT_459369 [Aspergillus glaucus CBS 516.65]OJJ83106.1 hypothetical protein ASPGLDRAFT_459369 [Aspergillus glaucus CBS 516.65]
MRSSHAARAAYIAASMQRVGLREGEKKKKKKKKKRKNNSVYGCYGLLCLIGSKGKKKKKTGISPVQWEGLSFYSSRCGRLVILSFFSQHQTFNNSFVLTCSLVYLFSYRYIYPTYITSFVKETFPTRSIDANFLLILYPEVAP